MGPGSYNKGSTDSLREADRHQTRGTLILRKEGKIFFFLDAPEKKDKPLLSNKWVKETKPALL